MSHSGFSTSEQAKQMGALFAHDPADVTFLAPLVELACAQCGYGIVSRRRPGRCPMCGTGAGWADPPRRSRTRSPQHGFAA